MRDIVPRLFSSHSNVALWALGLTVVAGISAMFLVESTVRYKSTISDAERSAQGYADLLAEHTARTFEAIEISLVTAQSIRSNLGANRSVSANRAANDSLQNLSKSSRALLAIEWTDENGTVLASSYQGNSPQPEISDLDHFRAQRDDVPGELYIAPLSRSKTLERWISFASIRLNNPDGSFAGIVTAPLDPSYFTRIYRMVKLGQNDSVTLLRTDGTVLAREPFVESSVGQSYGQTSIYRNVLSKQQSGIFATKSPIDGKNRLAAFRAVPGLPLIMVVSADREELLTQWNHRVWKAGILIGLLITGVILGTFLLSRRSGQLLKKTALLEGILGNMHQGLVVVDKSDQIVVCNRKAMELLDLPDDIIAHQAAQKHDSVSRAIKASLLPQTGSESNHLYERERPDSTILSVRNVPFIDGGSIRTYTDITRRKLLERELAERERQFRLLAENATDIIARLNFGGRLLYISPSLSSVLGYHPDELTGVKVTDFIHEDDVQSVVKFFSQILKRTQRGQKTFEYRFLHKNEKWIWLETSPTLVLDEDGNPLEFVDVVRDITKRKVIEAEADASRERAQHAARAQGQFLATMSHELRTPLNSIVGFSDIVLDRLDLNPDVRRQIGLIQTASDSLLTVVNDILDFSKIEDGKMELALVDFDLAKLIKDSVSIVHGAAHAKQLDLRVSIDERIASRLVGDDHRLRQILLNLLNNAIKFTRHGHVSLEIMRSDANETNNELRFSISDTGVGISHDRFDSLFRRFSQVDGTTSREFGGSGLGLAICKRLVEAMGGQIAVESTPGKGSTFWFTLSLPVGHASEPNEAPQSWPATRLASPRLLLVEDVEVNREIAISTLSHFGYQVDIANNGAEAVACVQSASYDLVLMDIQMPVMDGITATRQIRTLPHPKGSVPIVAMTANVLPSQLETFRSVGMNGHVGKPFRRADLVDAIESCLGPVVLPEGQSVNISEPVDLTKSQAFKTLSTLLGETKVEELLGKLKQQLQDFIERIPTQDNIDLRRQAHNLVASAGMLGLTSVSERCAEFENGLSAGDDVSLLLENVRMACLAALSEIAARSTGERCNIRRASNATAVS